MKILKAIPEHCPKCDKDVAFEIDMYYVEYNGIIPCVRCPVCNVVVPHYTFDTFLKTGRVAIGV